jgi:serine/threonine protein kinase
MIAITCSSCQKKLSVKDGLAGKKVKCPACGAIVAVPQAAAATLASQVGPGSGKPEEEKTLPPRNRSQAGNESLSDAEGHTDIGGGPKAEATRTLQSEAASGELTDFLAPPQAPDELGRLGGFRILKILGHGGMGVVFQGEDPRLGRKVAIKAMLPHLAGSKSSQERFLREARAAAALEHDHIVPILQVGEDRGAPFIVMPFLQGEPLDERLKREKLVSVAEVLRIGWEAAEGLAAAHQRGLIHRDIKPANIWLEGDKRRVKILDFGLARATSDSTGLTQTGAIVGTPQYMAPEQAAGKKDLDHRCDLFSLGCVLYRLSTGQVPFKGDDTLAILSALALDEPRPPSALRQDVPESLSDLVMQLLAKKPQERPESAQAVVEAIQEIEAQTAASSRSGLPSRTLSVKSAVPSRTLQRTGPARQAGPGGHGKKRLPWPWLVAAAGGLVVAVIGGIILLRQTPPGSQTAPVVNIDQDKGDNDKKTGVLKQQDKELAAKVVGRYKLAFRAETGSHKGATRWEFTQDRAIENGNDKGTWRIEGGKVILTYSQQFYGQVVLEFQGDNTLIGKHQQKNGQIFNWVLTRERSPNTGKLTPAFTNSLGMEFVLIPKGKSWLGGGGGRPGDNEVEITEDFYLGKYQVTQEEWEKVTGVNPSHFSRNGAGKDVVTGIPDVDLKRFPVEMVSWDDCRAFIDRLNERCKEIGWTYRLPTTKEWQYACRGGPLPDRSVSAFDFYLDKPMHHLVEQANFNDVLHRTCKVGSYRPNRLGLHDMHGNVWQWCDDADELVEDRFAMGGSWAREADCSRAARRDTAPRSLRQNQVGLRVARVPVGKEIVKVVAPETNKAGLEAGKDAERVYQMRTYYAHEGRLDDLHARFRILTVKLFAKHGISSIGYWTPIDNKDNKLVHVLAFPSREAAMKAWAAFGADRAWKAVKKKTAAKGPIVAKTESIFLKATDYSPIPKPAAIGDRIFELRIYTATPKNLDSLNARFRNHTMKLFEKHGMTNIGYWVPLEGEKGADDTLIYFLAHKSVDAARQSFAAFRDDPAWKAALKASEEKAGGPLTVPKTGVTSVMMKATDYSPLR